MLSDTTFPLILQHYLCFLWPLLDNPWSTRNMEKFMCNLGNNTEALGLHTNALCSLEVHRISLWFPGQRQIKSVPAPAWVERKWDQLFGPSGSQIRASQICTCLRWIHSKIYRETECLSLQPAAYPPSCTPRYSGNTMPTHPPNHLFLVTPAFYGPS